MPETWRAIPSCPGYEASDEGRIRSFKRGPARILKPHVARPGYLYFFRYQDGQFKRQAVHAAVAEAFHGPRAQGQVCRHLNGDAFDNRISNLLWGSNSENSHDAVRHGTNANAALTHCRRAGHPFDQANTRWVGNSRDCRACNREAVRRYKLRQRLSDTGQVVPS